MGNLMNLAALSTQSHLDNHIGLIPLVAGLSLVLLLLLAVVGYGVRRVKISEGLMAPIRVERTHTGPELTWASLTQPARKLVAHDALGLGSDLSWLNTRNIPAPLSARPGHSQPAVALEFGANVYVKNLPIAGPAAPYFLAQPTDNVRREKMAAQAAQSEKLAALRTSVGVMQPRAIAAAVPGQRPRTAVLRAADPRPCSTGTKPLTTSDTSLAQPVRAASSTASAPTARAVPQPIFVAPARVTEVRATPATAQVPAVSVPVASTSVGASTSISTSAAAPASKNSATVSKVAPEGRVTDYSFADFL